MHPHAFTGAPPLPQARLYRPDQHAKASRVCNRMEASGYDHDQINSVVLGRFHPTHTLSVHRGGTNHPQTRSFLHLVPLTPPRSCFAALVAETDDEMRGAFDLFAGSDAVVDADELHDAVPLIGEDLTDEQIRCLFKRADTNKAPPSPGQLLRLAPHPSPLQDGKIDFPEFCQMMYALTPKASPGGLLEVTEHLVNAQETLETALAAVDANPKDDAAVTTLGNAYAGLVFAEGEMRALTKDQCATPVEKGLDDHQEAAEVSVMEAASPPPAPARPRRSPTLQISHNQRPPGITISQAMDGSMQAWTAAKNLSPELYGRMYKPEDYTRVGRIMLRMQQYAHDGKPGYDEAATPTLAQLRSLALTQNTKPPTPNLEQGPSP